jgi:hypothetical protein
MIRQNKKQECDWVFRVITSYQITKTVSLFTASLLLFIFPLFSHADTIFLKNGTSLETKRTWEKDDKIMFFKEDLVTSIKKSDIERIEKANSGLLASSRIEKNKNADFGIPNGFRDLHWGSKLSDIIGMLKIETDTGLAGVEQYFRADDVLQIGEAKLNKIIYSFWREKLYTVTIWTQGYSNYKALRNVVFEHMGKGSQSDESLERYIWPDRLTDRMLEYVKEGEHGMLWMRSRNIDRRLKLSKYDASISYIKWLKSRDLEKSQTVIDETRPKE